MCEKKLWSMTDTNQLIFMYENRPELWNVKCKHYKNRMKKQYALNEMAETFSVTIEEVYRKLHNLRTQFNNEIRKGKKFSDEDNGEVFISRWPYFNQLKFLLGSTSVLAEDDIDESKLAVNEQVSADSSMEEMSCKKIKLDIDSYIDKRNYANNFIDLSYRDEKKLWSMVETNQLISMYASRPELWNAKSKHYKNRIKKRQAFDEIAQTFSVTVDEIYRKMHNLRTQFNNELRKTKRSTDQPVGEPYVSKWPYFDSLKFLLGCTERKSAANNTLAFEEGLDDGKLTAENEHISTDGSYMDESFMRNDISDPFSNLQDSRLEGTSRDEDQYDVFGKFIANELRHMKFDHLRRKLKRQIQELVLKVSAEEDELHEHHSSIVPAVEMN